MNLKFKRYIAITSFGVVFYTLAWFYAAHHFKNAIKDLPYKEENQQFSFKESHIEGFPFQLKAILTDINFSYKIKNSLLDIGIDLSADTLKLSSNFLANKIIVTFPGKLSFIVNNGDKESKFDIFSDKEHYLELHEKNLVNIHKIIYKLYSSEAITIDEFKLRELFYKSKKLNFINKDTNQEIFDSASEIRLKINHNDDEVNAISLKTNNFINIKDSEFVGYNFKELSTNIDVSTKVKPYGNILSILSANFNLLNLKIDNFSLNLNGKAKNDTNGKPEIDILLKILDFNNFINSLETQKLLSQEKSTILKDLIKNITGESEVNNADIKIYSAHDESTRIGNIDTKTFSAYLNQLIIGK